MKSCNTLIFLSALLLNGCTAIPKEHSNLIYGSGIMYQRWQDKVLEECSDKVYKVSLQIFIDKLKENILLSKQEIEYVQDYLLKKCSLKAGIVI